MDNGGVLNSSITIEIYCEFGSHFFFIQSKCLKKVIHQVTTELILIVEGVLTES